MGFMLSDLTWSAKYTCNLVGPFSSSQGQKCISARKLRMSVSDMEILFLFTLVHFAAIIRCMLQLWGLWPLLISSSTLEMSVVLDCNTWLVLSPRLLPPGWSHKVAGPYAVSVVIISNRSHIMSCTCKLIISESNDNGKQWPDSFIKAKYTHDLSLQEAEKPLLFYLKASFT